MPEGVCFSSGDSCRRKRQWIQPPAHSPKASSQRRLTLELSFEKIDHIDALKKEWGLRNRGDVLERLLEELFSPNPISSLPDASEAEDTSGAVQEDLLDDSAALVLVGIGEGAMEGWGMILRGG
jgi:hypothetical protein